MFALNENRHQDVLRVIVSSDKSFDDAVRDGLPEVQKHHPHIAMKTFEAVQLQGTIENGEVQYFQVVLDIAGVHEHHD
ncbi:MAG: dodecin family protein [Acidobacteriota bacterium]